MNTTLVETGRTQDVGALFAGRVAGMENDALAALLGLAGREDVISFAGGLPDPATFLTDRLAEVARQAIVDEPGVALQYGPTPGLSRTRDWFLSYLARREGVTTTRESVMVTSGGVEALDLLNKVLVDPGDVVLMEAPSYLGAEMVTTSYQGEVVGIPIDEDGLRVDLLRDTLDDLARRGRRPKFLYTIPDYQNPSGITLTGSRRAALVALAAERALLLVEDIAYRRLGGGGDGGAAPPSLWSLNPAGVVLIDTFAKTLFPASRVACVAAPPALIRVMTLAKQTTDQFASTLSQAMLVAYDQRGWLDEQVAHAGAIYARRRDAMLGAMGRLLPAGLHWTAPLGGFFTWLTLPEGADTAALAPRALARGVAYVPGQPFFAPGTDGRRYARLSYSYVPVAEIDEGLRRLAAVIEQARASGGEGI